MNCCLIGSQAAFLSALSHRLIRSGVLPGEAEDLWEHGHGHEAAEPPGQSSKGQAVKPRAAVELWPELHKKIG